MTPAFFTLHQDLPREGPGTADDVLWACELAGLATDARILDAGCGPGADIGPLLDYARDGTVLAVDTHAPFVQAAQARHGSDARVTCRAMDMGDADGPFDFIWSAGALYFLGIAAGLDKMRHKLAPGGALAFSHLVYTVDTPDPALRAMLDGEPDIVGRADLRDLIARAGYRLEGERVLSEAAWATYYTPMQARIDALRGDADADLQQVLTEGQAEIDMWRRFGAQFGYVLSVVRPQ